MPRDLERFAAPGAGTGASSDPRASCPGERRVTNEENEENEDVPTGDDDAKGALDADNPEIGEGTGEGEGGLGVQSGASGGAHPTEPEDATPERGQSAGNG